MGFIIVIFQQTTDFTLLRVDFVGPKFKNTEQLMTHVANGGSVRFFAV